MLGNLDLDELDPLLSPNSLLEDSSDTFGIIFVLRGIRLKRIPISGHRQVLVRSLGNRGFLIHFEELFS